MTRKQIAQHLCSLSGPFVDRCPGQHLGIDAQKPFVAQYQTIRCYLVQQVRDQRIAHTRHQIAAALQRFADRRTGLARRRNGDRMLLHEFLIV